MSEWKIPINEHQKVVELYETGMSQMKIGELYNVDRTVIARILKRNNVQLRDPSHRKRKYTLNENYFDEVDTPDKAYILGLLYADGCNYKNSINITLQEKDKLILDEIKEKLGSNIPLYYRKLNEQNKNHQNVYSLTFTNQHLARRLRELGMLQRKSLILTFPEWLDKSLYSHFIRGYFDGDGCFCGNMISIASTEQFCKHLQDVCLKELNITTYVKDVYDRENSPTKIFYVYGKNKVKKFLDYIYEDANMYIQRKYEHYIERFYSIAV